MYIDPKFMQDQYQKAPRNLNQMDEDLRNNRHIFIADPTVEDFAAAMDRALRADVRTIDDLSKYTWVSYTEQVLNALTDAVRDGRR